MATLSLLGLPAELRLHIYSFLPELQAQRNQVIGAYASFLIPPICHVNQQIRHETLPLYAKDAHFIFTPQRFSALVLWSQILGTDGLSTIRSLRVVRYWNTSEPRRQAWHRRSFIVEFTRNVDDGTWTCTAECDAGGTSSLESYLFMTKRIAMGPESVELLRRVILDAMPSAGRGDVKAGLSEGNIRLISAAIEIVASHPIEESLIPSEHPKVVRKQARQMRQKWVRLERQLCDLNLFGEYA